MKQEPGRTLSVACIGEVMIELSVQDEIGAQGAGQVQIAYAGDTFNTAVYLKRTAGPTASVAYVTVLGQDRFSDGIVRLMQDEHLCTGGVRRIDERLPGLYTIATDEQGDRSFSYWRDHSAARTLFQAEPEVDLAVLSGHRMVYFSAITLAILSERACTAFLSALKAARAEGTVTIAFDSNYRPRLWNGSDTARSTIERAWRVCDIGLPSLEDEMALFGDADQGAVIARLHGYGVNKGALKCGAEGPVSLSDPGSNARFEAAAAVVDSTAAGDSFNGAYLATVLGGGSEIQALQAGHALARKVVGHRGAIIAPEVLG